MLDIAERFAAAWAGALDAAPEKARAREAARAAQTEDREAEAPAAADSALKDTMRFSRMKE